MVNIMNWRKSSYSGSNSGNCVEVANLGDFPSTRTWSGCTTPSRTKTPFQQILIGAGFS